MFLDKCFPLRSHKQISHIFVRYRRQLAHIARKTKQREDLIARRAVLAAQAARAQCGADDAQATVCYYFADDDGRRELMRALSAKARIGKIAPDARGNAAICAIA